MWLTHLTVGPEEHFGFPPKTQPIPLSTRQISGTACTEAVDSIGLYPLNGFAKTALAGYNVTYFKST